MNLWYKNKFIIYFYKQCIYAALNDLIFIQTSNLQFQRRVFSLSFDSTHPTKFVWILKTTQSHLSQFLIFAIFNFNVCNLLIMMQIQVQETFLTTDIMTQLLLYCIRLKVSSESPTSRQHYNFIVDVTTMDCITCKDSCDIVQSYLTN